MRSSTRAIRRTSQRKINVARALAEDLRKSQLQLAHRPFSLADLGPLDDSPVPFALLSRSGVILAANAALKELFNLTEDQLRFRPLRGFLKTEHRSPLFRLLSSCEAGGKTRRDQFTIVLPGKPAVELLLIVNAVQSTNTPARILCRAAFVQLDDPAPREVGSRADREDARLLEAIDGIIWEAAPPMRFTYVSRQAERILGFPAEEWTRDPDFWEKHVHHEDRERVIEARMEAARKPAPHVLEYRMICANGRVIWVKDSAVVLPGALGRAKICGIITDVTDLERSGQELRRANERLEEAVAQRTAKMEQSLQAMETLCYGIAHDLKAPLRALQGFVGILLTDYEKVFDATARSHASRCQTAVQRMGELIDAVLAYGRLNHLLPEIMPVQVKPVIDAVLQALAPEIQARAAKISLPMRFPKVLGNPYLLEQVFTHLLTNALKFTARGIAPEINISASHIESAAGRHSGPGAVRLIVSDDGIGIPPDFVKRMFGLFQKFHAPREYPGSGIGLAIVKRAVELMNGRVRVLSEPGHGSSFWFELPAE